MKPEVPSPRSRATRLKGTRGAKLCFFWFAAGLLTGSNLIAAPVPREVINRAEVRFITGPGVSNYFTSLPVITLVPAPVVTDLAFFDDTSFGVRAVGGRIGRDLYIQSRADACNRDSNAVETCTITLSSSRT